LYVIFLQEKETLAFVAVTSYAKARQVRFGAASWPLFHERAANKRCLLIDHYDYLPMVTPTHNTSQRLKIGKRDTKRLIKNISIVLVFIATLLLIVDIVDIKLVFGKRETGLWDNMQGFVRQVLFVGYPICLLASFILFIWTLKVRTQFDTIAIILFLLNGISLIVLLIIYLKWLMQNL
jgi:hypothetical protein